MKKTMKKKGFTLIELIAVIAILAILGMVLVPKITGYMDSARKSNLQNSAKTIVHALQAFNADPLNATKVVNNTNAGSTTVAAAVILINGANPNMISTSNDSYTKLSGFNVDALAIIATGDFVYTNASPWAAPNAASTATIED